MTTSVRRAVRGATTVLVMIALVTLGVPLANSARADWSPNCDGNAYVSEVQVQDFTDGQFEIKVTPTSNARNAFWAGYKDDATHEIWHAVQACVTGLYGDLADGIYQQIECHVLGSASGPADAGGETYDFESWRRVVSWPEALANQCNWGGWPYQAIGPPYRPDIDSSDTTLTVQPGDGLGQLDPGSAISPQGTAQATPQQSTPAPSAATPSPVPPPQSSGTTGTPNTEADGSAATEAAPAATDDPSALTAPPTHAKSQTLGHHGGVSSRRHRSTPHRAAGKQPASRSSERRHGHETKHHSRSGHPRHGRHVAKHHRHRHAPRRRPHRHHRPRPPQPAQPPTAQAAVQGCNTYGSNCDNDPIYQSVPPDGYDYRSYPRVDSVNNGTVLTAECWTEGGTTYNYAANWSPPDYGPNPYASNVYYRVQAPNGGVGFIPDTWFARDKENKLSLPHC